MVTAFFPPKVNGLTIPAARAGPRTRGPMLALPNTAGAAPKALSRRTLKLSPGIFTRATMRTVALVILVSPSACCDVPHAVTQAWSAFCALAFWAMAAGASDPKVSAKVKNNSLSAMLSSHIAPARHQAARSTFYTAIPWNRSYAELPTDGTRLPKQGRALRTPARAWEHLVEQGTL